MDLPLTANHPLSIFIVYKRRFSSPALSLLGITLLGLTALGVTAGCGRSSDSGKKPFLPIVISGGKPAEYTLEDPDCQSSQAAVALDKTTVRQWNQYEIQEQTVDLAGVRSLKSLTSPLVHTTRFNNEFIRHCDLSRPASLICADDKGQEKGWSLTPPASMLRVCKNNHTYDRTSYEGVALTGLYYIETAYNRYLANLGSRLPTIELSVLPKFMDIYNNFQTSDGLKQKHAYLMHNLAYFPPNKTLIIFPERDDLSTDSRGFLWESAFVLAHETAHHIDFAGMPTVHDQLGLRWNPLLHKFQDLSPMAMADSGSSPAAAIQGSVSEGFADLSAYYALSGDTSSLVGIPCFGHNRDIRQTEFSNGDKKRLTPERLNYLLERTAEDPKVCGEPRYGDIHIGGAILAHILDQAFSTLIKEASTITPDSQADYDQRYVLLWRWLQNFYKSTLKLQAGSSGEDMLGPINDALKVVSDQFIGNLGLREEQANPVRTNVCRIMQEGFPVVKTTAPYARNGECGYAPQRLY